MICPFCDSNRVQIEIKKEKTYQKCVNCKTKGAVNEIYNKNVRQKTQFYIPFGLDSFLHYQSKL